MTTETWIKEELEAKMKNKGITKIILPDNALIFTQREYQAEQFIKENPLFYDRTGLWWVWDKEGLFYKIIDDVDILNIFGSKTHEDIVKSGVRVEVVNALKQVGRKNIPKTIKPSWIQFKNKIIDIENGEEIEPSPEYFTVNPIPYALHKDKLINTPTMDRLFEEWVGKENVLLLYQILAYCLIPDYPIHRLFCLIGSGMNGKSCFLRMIQKFIGAENCCSTELDTLMESRFEITRLHKKLVCMMGETNFNELTKTSKLKKLTGQDLIGFEYKGKTPFQDTNYAKIIIATNNLPETSDKTTGFYRRWLIIDFPNQFDEKKDILATIPEEEYECLARKCILIILPDLLRRRRFENEGSLEDRQRKFEDKSNPLDKFLKDRTEEDFSKHIWKFEFEREFNQWCKENRYRIASENSIGLKMKQRGYNDDRKLSDWLIDGQKKQLRCWVGLGWKK